MFCRRKADIDAEEAAKKAAQSESTKGPSKQARNVLSIKVITDTAMKIASIRIPAQDVVEALFSLDEFAFNID